ncbi:MAG: hypothetical protein GF341_03200 [candidate division Zixibacteria bacterium]|nr:hypothetical protein [candidate division Zixibacteria bacterium]
MKRTKRHLQQIATHVVLAAVLLLVVFPASYADPTYEQQQEIWKDFSNTDKAAGIAFHVFQEAMGNDETQQFIDDYADAVTLIKVHHELFQTGSLSGAVTVIKDRLQDKLIAKLAPDFNWWLGWMKAAKAGMELFKDFVFDPMVEQSQIDTYVGLRESGLDPEDAFAGVRGYGYIVERGKKEFRKEYGDLPFQTGTNELLPKWRADFREYIKAGMENAYHRKLHRDLLERSRQLAAEAEAKLPAMRDRLLTILRQYRVAKVELSPATASLNVGDQVVFDAIGIYADPSAPRSATDVTAQCTWSGGTDDNVFVATEKDAGRTVTIIADYYGVTGAATVTVLDADTTESIDDALADVREDEEEGEGEETGEDAEDEILDDIQRQFDEAVRRFGEHHNDFIARLQSLAGESSDAICGDGTLAFSLAAASDAFLDVEGYYTDALAAVRLAGNLSAAATGRTPTAAEDFDPANVEGLGVFDQIAMRMMQEDYAAVLADVEDMGTRLDELAPGCDPEEMLDAGRRVAESDQDPESGVDIAGGTGVVGDGGGELRFEADQLGSETDFSASCTGGSMTLNMDPPTFPQQILPDGSYTVSVSVSWSTSGSQIKDVSMLVSILINQELRVEREFETFSGSRTVTATVRGSDVDFGEQVIAMSVVVGGGLMCENNSSDGLGAVYNQVYFRRGSE